MVRVLLVGQDKGGVGKTLLVRGLAEALPEAPVIEVDSTQRLLELKVRTHFFPMRVDRSEIERTGGKAARGEFDGVIAAVAGASLPTIVDIGANTASALLGTLAELKDDLAEAGVELGILVVVTAEPGARAEAPKLMALTKGWTKRFVVENRLHGPVEPVELKKIADGGLVTVLDEQVMEDKAAELLQKGGLASIPKLDTAALTKEFGLPLGSRIRRDLTRTRLKTMEAVEPAARWLVGE
ncbi:hypothetical protein [Aurantimonas sp. VKM B-3413]|uniref:hypothetical protein n=1 Tax=Aurantimonas sp. VKM B-3413 TaxID=2779401 RepID=UPI001E3E4D8E|nr:hypothetical protein [Aurantimonas sp. VKM B-3413]MCB8839362.1 hypothetical protein [Aurantimonas sp. VKM B-3413]